MGLSKRCEEYQVGILEVYRSEKKGQGEYAISVKVKVELVTKDMAKAGVGHSLHWLH